CIAMKVEAPIALPPTRPADATERTMLHHPGPRAPFARRLPLAVVAWLLSAATLPAALHVSPAKVILDGPETTQQLLVTAGGPAAPLDVTRAASYQVRDAGVVTVDAAGLVRPGKEGTTEIVIRHKGEVVRVAAAVTGLRRPVPVSFVAEVVPLFTKAGCNAG